MRGPRAAVTAVFALNGAAFASVFARMPELQREQGLTDAELGLVLLGSALGLMVAQPLAGALTVRAGSRPVAVGGALAYVLAVPLPALAPAPGAFAAAMVLLGASNGVLDVSMNAQGLAVERRHPRRIFASFHAAFSFGALAGAGGGGLAATAGIAPDAHLPAAAAALVVVLLVARRGLLPASADAAGRHGPAFARPSRKLAALGALAFCALLAEGAVNDWSAILLDRETGAGPGLAAFGLAAFALAMGAGRLTAEALAARLGPVAVVRAGGLLAALGLALTLATGAAGTGIAGFALMGAGLSGAFPLTLGAAGAGGAPALAAVSTTGYVGFIAGPAVIGLLSGLASLPAALCLVVALCLAMAALAGAAGRDTAADG